MDRELNELLAHAAADESHRERAWRTLAKSLGQCRRLLIDEGFTTQGAEDIARDFAGALVDLTLNGEPEDDGE